MLSDVTKLRHLSVFLVCTSLILASVVAWLASQIWQTHPAQQRFDEDIVFSNKLFQNANAYVYVSGTLTGDWIGYKNNTFSILCISEECLVANLDQIGPRQVSRIIGPTVYPVVSWTRDEVVASDNSLCAKITITIDRNTQTLLWVETPINQTRIECKNADNTIRKATIEHSLYWQRSKARE